MSNTKDTPMDYKQFEGHTPGPWKTGFQTEKRRLPIIEIVSTAESGVIGVTLEITGSLCDVIGHHDEAKANAKLVASAPDLLKENQELKLELQKQNRRIEVYKSILDIGDNKIHEWQKWEQVKDKELASKDAELQKQKEIKKQILRSAFKAGGGYARNEQWPDFEEWYESLIKKSSEI